MFARVYSSWFADDSTASQFLVFLALTPLFSQGCLFFVKIAKTVRVGLLQPAPVDSLCPLPLPANRPILHRLIICVP